MFLQKKYTFEPQIEFKFSTNYKRMKVYLTSDSHFGVHSNDRDWLKTQLDYYYNFFIIP